MKISPGVFFLAVAASLLQAHGIYAEEQEVYGVDHSFAVHHGIFDSSALGKERTQKYDDYMQGCRDMYEKKGNICDETERERLVMSVRQPQSMVNYTDAGYKKIKAPEPLFRLIQSFWEQNKHSEKKEQWPAGNIYTNHWKSPTYLTSIEDTTFQGGGRQLKNAIWEAAQTTIEEWTGMEQEGISLYGIRSVSSLFWLGIFRFLAFVNKILTSFQ